MTDVLTTAVVPGAVFAGSTVALLLTRTIAFRLLHRWAARTHSHVDDLVIHAFRLPSLFWCLALGLFAGLAVSEWEPKYVEILHRAIKFLVVISVTIAGGNLAGRALKAYVQEQNLPFPSTRLAEGVLRGGILVVGFLVALGVVGVSVAPMLTALGVGGLAVALALQDTLANLFAGIHILLEKSIRVGDFVRLESGQEGFVTDITWRTTRVRMLPNNMVVIPNSKLSQSVVTNYYLPEQRMSLLISINVDYGSDPEHVERVLVEEARTAAGSGEIPGLLAEPEPFVRFIPGFGESSLDFTLICQVREFTDQYLAQHELRKRIFRRFRAERIEIPFPQRTVHLRGTGARPDPSATS